MVFRGDGTGYDIGADEFIGHPAAGGCADAIKALIVGRPLDPIPSGLELNRDGLIDAGDLVLALIPAP